MSPLAQSVPKTSDSKKSDGLATIAPVREHLRAHFRGSDEVIEFSLATFLAGGHLLLEGPPGAGKTSLAKAMASAFGGKFRRIQMTADLLPSDVVGILRMKPGAHDFEFRPGPVFTHFLLADELNRTSPKTQSALLEAMAESTVSIDGVTHPLPNPFFVVATQNPSEFHGVYPLAESQLDRFMLQLTVGSPDKKDELKIYSEYLNKSPTPGVDSGPAPTALLSLEQTLELRALVALVFIESSVLEYASDLVRATRTKPNVQHGVSVRGGLQLIAASRALAFTRGRDFVTPKDVSDLAIHALGHRIQFSGGDPDTVQRQNLIQEILEQVKQPR